MSPQSREPRLSPDAQLVIVVVCQIAIGFLAVALLTSAPGVEMSTTSLIMRIGAVALIAIAIAMEVTWLVFDEVRHVFPFSAVRVGATLFLAALVLMFLS